MMWFCIAESFVEFGVSERIEIKIYFKDIIDIYMKIPLAPFTKGARGIFMLRCGRRSWVFVRNIVDIRREG